MIRNVTKLGFPWATSDPYLFCVYHSDAYPRGNSALGPDASLDGRNLGNDFQVRNGWRMYHGTTVPGFPVHPHRGFETVTVVRKGIVDHSDSLGGAGRYGHGDVQWMTAGKGIQHAEMFPLLHADRDNPLELFQIWLNLPKAKKYAEPFYTMLWAGQIPVHLSTGDNGQRTRVEIVAGSAGGQRAPDPAPDSWAADPENEVAIWYIEMETDAKWTLPKAGADIWRSLYFFEGTRVSIAENTVESKNAIELDPTRDVVLENGNAAGRFLLLQGKPIREPVANFGPFVMNTRSEIQQTYIDYQQTQFGGWPWPRHDQIHGPGKGRFALYPDGREIYPKAD